MADMLVLVNPFLIKITICSLFNALFIYFLFQIDFVHCASLTVNIDLSDVTNRYTVLYCTVRLLNLKLVYEKKNPNIGSTVQWETRQASFPTGTVGPRVGIFLSPLDTNDGFYLSHKPVPALGKDKN